MQHRKVPGIANLRPSIPPSTLPPIQSPMMLGQQPQQTSPESAIAEQVRELALEIYSQLAVGHIEGNPEADTHALRKLAQSAQRAAITYFQALGVQFQEDTTNG